MAKDDIKEKLAIVSLSHKIGRKTFQALKLQGILQERKLSLLYQASQNIQRLQNSKPTPSEVEKTKNSFDDDYKKILFREREITTLLKEGIQQARITLDMVIKEVKPEQQELKEYISRVQETLAFFKRRLNQKENMIQEELSILDQSVYIGKVNQLNAIVLQDLQKSSDNNKELEEHRKLLEALQSRVMQKLQAFAKQSDPLITYLKAVFLPQIFLYAGPALRSAGVSAETLLSTPFVPLMVLGYFITLLKIMGSAARKQNILESKEAQELLRRTALAQ